jgi:hypothetical protein
MAPLAGMAFRYRMETPMKRLLLLLGLASLLVSSAWGDTCTPQPAGMVSWWRGEGNELDAAGTNHGAAQNGLGHLAGMVGSAFAFDGVDDYVAVPHDASLDITGDLTVDAWIYVAALGDQRVIVSKRSFDNQNANIIFFLDVTGQLVFASRSGGGPFNPVSSSGAVPLNQWTFVAVTISGTTLTFHINGVAETPQVFSGTRASNTGRLTIGIVEIDPILIPPNGLAAPFNGLIDEPEVFAVALSAADLAAIYAAGSAGKCLGPIGVEAKPWGAVKHVYR